MGDIYCQSKAEWVWLLTAASIAQPRRAARGRFPPGHAQRQVVTRLGENREGGGGCPPLARALLLRRPHADPGGLPQ